MGHVAWNKTDHDDDDDDDDDYKGCNYNRIEIRRPRYFYIKGHFEGDGTRSTNVQFPHL